MNGQGGVVWLNNSVGDLGGWNDGESGHHPVGKLLTYLRDQKGTHTGTSTTTKGVGDLETLEAITSFSLTTNDIKDLVDELSTLSVMSLSPVVTSTRLTKNEVVWTEELAKRTSAYSIHGTGLKIDKNGTRNIFISRGLLGAS